MFQTDADADQAVPEPGVEALGARDGGVVRVSVGLEHVEDLRADLDGAIDAGLQG